MQYYKKSSKLKTFNSVLLALSLGVAACTSDPYSNNPNIYIVKNGDTLGGIATRYKQNYKVLARLNNLDANYTIYAGQPLRLNTNAPSTPQSLAPQKVTTYLPPKSAIKPAVSPTTNASNTPPSTTVPATSPTTNHVTTPMWQWPVRGTVLQKMDVATGIKGIYIGGNIGDIIKSAADGEVVYADNKLKGYGNLILIRHDSGYITAYAHNSQMLVTSGNKVQAGQAIGIMGMGKLNQPMMEFQIRLKGNPQDPMLLLPQIQ